MDDTYWLCCGVVRAPLVGASQREVLGSEATEGSTELAPSVDEERSERPSRANEHRSSFLESKRRNHKNPRQLLLNRPATVVFDFDDGVEQPFECRERLSVVCLRVQVVVSDTVDSLDPARDDVEEAKRPLEVGVLE